MVIAGSDSAVIMVESEAKELSEDQMLGGILFAHQEMQPVIEAIKEMAKDVGKPPFEYEPKSLDSELIEKVKEAYGEGIEKAYEIKIKQERVTALNELKEKMISEMIHEESEF